MDINEKSYLVGICWWLTQQPEHKEISKEDVRSIFYHVSEMRYAELILRYVRCQEIEFKKGNDTIFDIKNNRLIELEEENRKLKFIIENGLEAKDLENYCT
jgi:hypothetical protein